MQTPDQTLERPLMGVREFAIGDDGYLRSPVVDVHPWLPDTVERAECHGNPASARYEREAHDVPGNNCKCGYYAFYSTEAQMEHGGGYPDIKPLRAVVSAWGDVITHDVGFRAEYMQIEALVVWENQEDYPLITGSSLSPAEAVQEWHQLAERYAVPLLAPSEGDAFCRQHGEVLEAMPYVDPADVFVQVQARISHSFRMMVKELQSMMERMNRAHEFDNRSSRRKPNNWQEAIEAKRNKPAFWRDVAGGETHDGR